LATSSLLLVEYSMCVYNTTPEEMLDLGHELGDDSLELLDHGAVKGKLEEQGSSVLYQQ